jgi:hypothetical protein
MNLSQEEPMRLIIGFCLFALMFGFWSLDNEKRRPTALLVPVEAADATSTSVLAGMQGVRYPETVTGQPGSWPQQATKRTVDVTELKNEAKELSKLAGDLPQQMDQIGGGKLPKDLIETLKKIEKLAKHIRGEVS